MKNFARLLSALLIALMITTTFAGCGNANDGAADNADTVTAATSSDVGTAYVSEQKAKWFIGENKTLDWYLDFSWWTWTKKWKEYPILKEITDITGVSCNVTIPAADGDEKINLMIASGDLPDMITMDYNGANVNKLISHGYLYSINELCDKYCPEFKNEIDADIWKAGSYEGDGKLYGLPSWFVTSTLAEKYGLSGTQIYMVRKDIYEELGSPDISTPVKLLEALRAFKTKYPTINGKPSIALSLNPNLWYKEVIRRCFGVREYYLDPSSNKIVSNVRDPHYADVIKFLNQLGREGLISKEELVDKQEQVDQDRATRVFMVAVTYGNMKNINKSLEQQKADSRFISIPSMNAVPEERDNTKIYPKTSRSGWTTTLITKNCKDPETALKFARYMWSKDGNLLAIYGHEGEHYTINGNDVTKLPKFDEDRETLGIKSYEFFESGKVRLKLETSDKDEENDRKCADQYVYDNTVLQYKMIPDPTSPEGIIKTQVDEIELNAWAFMMFAPTEAEALETYRKMVKDMDQVGLLKLEAWWQERVGKNVNLFGPIPDIW